jgi:hypothetical protein
MPAPVIDYLRSYYGGVLWIARTHTTAHIYLISEGSWKHVGVEYRLGRATRLKHEKLDPDLAAGAP